MDDADFAQERIEAELERAISAARRVHNGPAATHCVDCGEDIPEERRQAIAGVRTCAYCQAIREKR
jgi:phage/conjugal plasmid C-4 type zinc finger TraR family protein